MAVPSSLPVCPLCQPALPQRRVPHSIPLAAGSRQESRAVFPQFLDSFLLGLNKSPHCFPNEQLPEVESFATGAEFNCACQVSLIFSDERFPTQLALRLKLICSLTALCSSQTPEGRKSPRKENENDSLRETSCKGRSSRELGNRDD
ncbi:hypothetical protein EK904_004850, partial [Melospiza melodia maxima]